MHLMVNDGKCVGNSEYLISVLVNIRCVSGEH